MYSARQIYEFCRERITWLPERPDPDNLHGVFAELTRPDIELLFGHIDSGREMLPRLLSALNPNQTKIDTTAVLNSFVAAFRCVMPFFLDSPDCDRWNVLSVDGSIQVDDDDLIHTVYDEFGDWLAYSAPGNEHPIHMLREAMFSIKADYMISRYITWPLNDRKNQATANPLEPLFELTVRGLHLVFQGDRVNAIKF